MTDLSEQSSNALSPREQIVVSQYLEHGNKVEAVRQAGYSFPNVECTRVFRRPHVVEAIREAMKARNEHIGIDKAFVLNELLEVLQVAKANVKPKLNSKTGKPIKDADGNPVYTRNDASILKALELLGKHVDIDAFNNKIDVNVSRDQDLLNAMKAGSERLKNAPKFDGESETD